MKHYPAYPAYKTTGCDWFPEIPTHWEIDRAKWSVSSCQNGVWGAEPDGDDDLVCIRVADFDRQSLRVSMEKLTMRSIAERDRRNRLLKNGDLLLEKSGGGEQQLVGAVVEFNQPFPAVTSNFIARMVASDGMNSRFLVYLHSHLYSGRVNFRSIKQTTGIQNLDSQAYLDEPVTYPPLGEQQAIARFLDFKTAQIDALIAKKKALLDKLAEKRTSLISHAVTRGLDPSVAMKDSGVTWLGDIPAHWEPMRLRFCMKTNPSKGEIKLNDDELVSFIPMEAVGEFGGLNLGVEKELGEIGGGYTYFADNDVVVAKITPCFENGKGAIARGLKNRMAFGTTELHVMRSDDTLLPDYLFHLTMSHPFRCIGESEMYGAGGQKRVPETFLKDFRIGLPPVNEQQDIIAYINKVNQKLDLQMSKAADVIGRLTEYRSALITNAVTGKIDVRGFDVPQIAEGIAL
jgi:type I restriction enzyme, S subunit